MKTWKGRIKFDLKFGALGLISTCFMLPMESLAADEKPAFCPYAEGQTIKPLSMLEAYNTINPENLKKDEFETTLAFQNRKEKSKKLSRSPFPVLGSPDSIYRRRFIRYDADREVTFIGTDELLSPIIYFDYAVGRNWQGDNLRINYHAIQLGKFFRRSNYRNVINDAGANIKVQTLNTQYVHIFMGAKQQRYDDLFIGEKKRKFGNIRSGAIEIPMKIEDARRAEKSLQFVPIIQARKPYTGWLEYFGKADVNKLDEYGEAIEVDAEMPVIFADISCLAITNENYEILKIVKANRPPPELSGPVLGIEMPK